MILFKLYDHLVARSREDEGQTLVEYALILAFVSVLSIGALTLLSAQINRVFTTVTNAL
jgi:Flp pilus assembly pilin Flp